MKFRNNEEMFYFEDFFHDPDEFLHGVLIKRDAEKVSKAVKLADDFLKDEGVMGLAIDKKSKEYKAIALVREFIVEAQKEGKVIF